MAPNRRLVKNPLILMFSTEWKKSKHLINLRSSQIIHIQDYPPRWRNKHAQLKRELSQQSLFWVICPGTKQCLEQIGRHSHSADVPACWRERIWQKDVGSSISHTLVWVQPLPDSSGREGWDPKDCGHFTYTESLNEVKAITIFHILKLHGEDPPFSCKLNFTSFQSNLA